MRNAFITQIQHKSIKGISKITLGPKKVYVFWIPPVDKLRALLKITLSLFKILLYLRMKSLQPIGSFWETLEE